MSITESSYLRWENPSNGRYYEAHLGRDLFGDCLTLVWGRKNASAGQVRHYALASAQEGFLKINQIIKQRTKRGYFLKELRKKIDK